MDRVTKTFTDCKTSATGDRYNVTKMIITKFKITIMQQPPNFR